MLVQTVEHPDVVSHSFRWRTRNHVLNTSRNSQAKEAARSALQRLGQTAIPAIIEQVSGHNPKKCDLFLPILLDCNDLQAQEAVRTLLTSYVRERSKKRISPFLLYSIGLTLIVIVKILLSSMWHTRIALFYLTTVPLTLQIGITAAMSLYMARLNLSDPLRKSIICKCEQAASVEWLGTMLFLLKDSNAEVKATAKEALLHILPQIKASDSSKIEPDEMAALINALDSRRLNLTIAILQALEQVGDERALPKVAALSRELEGAKGETKRRIRGAAEACLPYLRQKAEIASQSRTLLRASSASHEEAESVLLRASCSAGTTDSSELLRAEMQ